MNKVHSEGYNVMLDWVDRLGMEIQLTRVLVICLKHSRKHQVWCLAIGRLLRAVGMDKKANC